MLIKRTAIWVCLASVPLWGKSAAAPNIDCDEPISDSQGNAIFTCHGLNAEQTQALPSLSAFLQKWLRSGLDASRLDARSDDVLNLLRGPASSAVSEPKAKPEATSKSDASAPAVATPPKEVITYDYRGYEISSLTGVIASEAGESEVYQKLLNLQNAKEWKKLVKDSTREIKRVPNWLTPYAFKAVALHHLNENKQAISLLEYVDQHSQGNPDYDQVRNLLHHLKPAPSAP